MEVKLKDLFGEDCIRKDDGEKLYSIIHPELAAGHKVSVDFTGVRVVTSLFLNPGIGRLFEDLTEQQIKERLHVRGLTDMARFTLNRVAMNSREFYSNAKYREAVTHAMDAIEA